MHAFDYDTDTTAHAPGERSALLSERYNIGSVPNGGYVLALAGRALCETLARPDPLTITGHYLAPTQPGPARLVVNSAPDLRRLACASACLIQEGSERARFLGTCSDLSRHQGTDWTDGRAPLLPPIKDCVPAAGGALLAPMPFHDTVEVRLDPACGDWRRAGDGPAELRGYLAFADGRPPDSLALLLFADAMPPAIFRVLGNVGWVPTVELTVQLRARPAPGPVGGVFRTRYITGGLLEEDGMLWDSTGRLVALSRQLALVREAPAGR